MGFCELFHNSFSVEYLWVTAPDFLSLTPSASFSYKSKARIFIGEEVEFFWEFFNIFRKVSFRAYFDGSFQEEKLMYKKIEIVFS